MAHGWRSDAADPLNDFAAGTGQCCRCGRTKVRVIDFLMPYMQAALQLCGDCLEQVIQAAISRKVIERGHRGH